MDMNLSKLQELVKALLHWHAEVHGVAKSRTWLSNWTTIRINKASGSIHNTWPMCGLSEHSISLITEVGLELCAWPRYLANENIPSFNQRLIGSVNAKGNPSWNFPEPSESLCSPFYRSTSLKIWNNLMAIFGKMWDISPCIWHQHRQNVSQEMKRKRIFFSWFEPLNSDT